MSLKEIITDLKEIITDLHSTYIVKQKKNNNKNSHRIADLLPADRAGNDIPVSYLLTSNSIKYVFLLIVLSFFLSFSSQSMSQEQIASIKKQAATARLALVIGNSDYHQGALKNPVNDARDFASTLRKLGFEVILKTNASLQEMDRSIDQFGRKLEKTKGVGLFYYAGHGVQFKGKNYLIPVTADIERETELKYKTLDAQRVIDEMEYAQNGLNIVVLDACRNNPLTRSFRSGKRGLARFDNTPSGLMVAYSTAPGKQAADGNGRNSPYTQQLIRSVQKDNLPLEMVFKDVIKNVKRATKGEQIPWVSSSVDGDFYFSQSTMVAQLSDKKSNSVSVFPKQSVNNSLSQSKFELLFWENVSQNPSKEKYKAYLDQYPQGHFASIAEYELQQLTQAPISRPKQKSISADITKRSLNNIEQCQDHFTHKRLTSGKQGNAFSCYKKILSNDPENREALAGINEIEATYILWASSAIRRNKHNKAQTYLEKLKFINPENKEIPKLEDEISLEQAENKGYNSLAYQSRSLSKKSQRSSSITSIRTQFQTAIMDRDVILAELLLKQIESRMSGSMTYQNLNMEYKQLVFQMESEKLYETLILDAFEKKDLTKAEHYLNKLGDVSKNSEHYLQLKKQLADKLEADKKVHIVLTANINDNLVIINGIEKGSTPLDMNLPKGDYLVELKKRGYPSQRMQLALYGDTAQHFKLTDGFATGIALENPPEGIEMMAIEPGCFNMGSLSSEKGRGSGERLHNVCIKQGFWMGKYEITQQQWQKLMQKNLSYFNECGAKCPVENVEWYEIQTFLKILSNKSGHKYRLPTEAEWEYAARSGTETPFYYGQCLEHNKANFNTKYKYNECTVSKEHYRNSTIAVGSFTGNAWGLHDMHGNVSEWTCSAYNNHYDGTEQYCHKPKDDDMPGYSEQIAHYAVRGGAWQYKPAYARSAYRDKEFPNANNKKIGFRVVREK